MTFKPMNDSMNRYAIVISLLCELMLCCTSPNQPKADISREFHIPIIIQESSKDTLNYHSADCISEADFDFIGKFKFTDTLTLKKYDEGYLNAKHLIPHTDIVFERSSPKPLESLATDGFQIIPDYKTTICPEKKYEGTSFCYFPVYVINETSATKAFFAKGHRVFGIQEALDTSSGSLQWRPIEHKPIEVCANGSFIVNVHPGEFIMFLAPKYQGELKRGMRIRLMVDESLYISAPYQGTFSAKQFDMSKESLLYNFTKNSRFPLWSFYGAIPRELDTY
jgi:hypothetical protein